MDNKITKILAEEIKDSRGNPTIKVTVYSDDKFGSFSTPSGASTGVHEVYELRDPEPKQPARQLTGPKKGAGGARYGADSDGRGGMKKSIWSVENIIAPALIGKDILNQKEIDRIMIKLDGTPNKNNLGGNSMIGVSIACAKVAAKISNQEVFQYLRTLAEIKQSRRVPYLYLNLINGGKHTKNALVFQEYLVVPETEDAKEAVEIGTTIQNTLKEIILKELGKESIILGDEGGFAPKISDIRKPLLYLSEAIRQNNLQGKVRIALDAAANSFYSNGLYKIVDSEHGRGIDGKNLTKEELLSIYNSLIKEFNLLSIEDPFYEEDFESFNKLKENNKGLLVVGDDLTVTNKVFLKEAIEKGSVNAMIIKPNQIGTLSETLETMKLARENNIELIVSHRSGETDEDFISDLAYAFGCFGLKAGSPQKPERMVKYKRLIRIANLLLIV